MNAFWLAFYDIKSLARERGLLALLAALLLVSGWALWQGRQFSQTVAAAQAQALAHQQRAQADAQALAARLIAAPEAPEFQDMKWWRSPADLRGYAFYELVDHAHKPLLPGAALAVGHADVLPALLTVRTESMEAALASYELEHPARLAMGRFDLGFCLVYLWPLALLALNAGVLTRERENRRLAALQLQGVSPLVLLQAQVGARGLLLWLGASAALGTLAWASDALPAEGGLATLARWAGLLGAYTAFWAAVAAVIAARAANRMTAAFAGFAAWVLLALVLPGVLTSVVQWREPVPGREHFIAAMRDAGDRVNADKLGTLARFYDQHPQWKPAKAGAVHLAKLSNAVTRLPRMLAQEQLLSQVQQDFAQARERREALFEQLLWLSPATLMQENLERLAGHDRARHQRFLAELAGHHQALRAFFHARIQLAAQLEEQRGACPPACPGAFTFVDHAAVPRFTPSPALGQPGPGLAWPLLAWAAALTAGAGALLRRRP